MNKNELMSIANNLYEQLVTSEILDDLDAIDMIYSIHLKSEIKSLLFQYQAIVSGIRSNEESAHDLGRLLRSDMASLQEDFISQIPSDLVALSCIIKHTLSYIKGLFESNSRIPFQKPQLHSESDSDVLMTASLGCNAFTTFIIEDCMESVLQNTVPEFQNIKSRLILADATEQMIEIIVPIIIEAVISSLDDMNGESSQILILSGLISSALLPEQISFLKELKEQAENINTLNDNAFQEEVAEAVFVIISSIASGSHISKAEAVEVMQYVAKEVLDQSHREMKMSVSKLEIIEPIIAAINKAETEISSIKLSSFNSEDALMQDMKTVLYSGRNPLMIEKKDLVKFML